MIAIEVKQAGRRADGKNAVRALIVSDGVPSPLPTTGAGITGLNDSDVFAPMSVIYVVSNVKPKVYISNESGVFVGQEE